MRSGLLNPILGFLFLFPLCAWSAKDNANTTIDRVRAKT